MRIKKTSIDWCPYIPEHWEVKRIKDIAFLQSGNSITALDLHDDALYPVYGGNGFRGFTDTYTNEGDYVLIGRQGALCGNINYAHGKFFATEHAVVVYTKKGEITRWLGETLNIANLNRLSMTAAQPGLAVSAINNQPIPYPPQNERKRIAEYLNDKTGKIDARVSLLSKKRDAYQRLKKALISRVVTKGLNPNAKFKPSGVDWIGEIPEGWEVKRIKDVVELVSEKTNDNSMPYIGLENIESWTARYIPSDSTTEGTNNMFHSGDVLFGKLRPYLAKGYLPQNDGICSTEFFVLRPYRNVHNKYVLYFILSHQVIDYLKNQVAGVKMPRTNWDSFSNLTIPLPNSAEQQSIASYLDEKCSEIDATIANLEKQIEKYKELKRALISEVVTGKRRV